MGCEHRNRSLIRSYRGTGRMEHVTLCRDCGRFDVTIEKDGVRVSTSFDLPSNESLIAASRAVTDAGITPKECRERVWKPLDFAQLRLYEVRLGWQLKDGKRGKEAFIVAADSPNQTPQSAANLIRKIYAESYDSNPLISDWYVQGYALNVLQPRAWTENGISMFNNELISAVRRYLNADPVEQVAEWQMAYQEMVKLVAEERDSKDEEFCDHTWKWVGGSNGPDGPTEPEEVCENCGTVRGDD